MTCGMRPGMRWKEELIYDLRRTGQARWRRRGEMIEDVVQYLSYTCDGRRQKSSASIVVTWLCDEGLSHTLKQQVTPSVYATSHPIRD